jgi:hypothetical protein
MGRLTTQPRGVVPGVVHQGKASHIPAVLSANICPVGGIMDTALPVPLVGTLIKA